MGSTETESFAIEWTPNGGARAVDDVEVPEAWSKALRGICHDLGRRQYYTHTAMTASVHANMLTD